MKTYKGESDALCGPEITRHPFPSEQGLPLEEREVDFGVTLPRPTLGVLAGTSTISEKAARAAESRTA